MIDSNSGFTDNSDDQTDFDKLVESIVADSEIGQYVSQGARVLNDEEFPALSVANPSSETLTSPPANMITPIKPSKSSHRKPKLDAPTVSNDTESLKSTGTPIDIQSSTVTTPCNNGKHPEVSDASEVAKSSPVKPPDSSGKYKGKQHAAAEPAGMPSPELTRKKTRKQKQRETKLAAAAQRKANSHIPQTPPEVEKDSMQPETNQEPDLSQEVVEVPAILGRKEKKRKAPTLNVKQKSSRNSSASSTKEPSYEDFLQHWFCDESEEQTGPSKQLSATKTTVSTVDLCEITPREVHGYLLQDTLLAFGIVDFILGTMDTYLTMPSAVVKKNTESPLAKSIVVSLRLLYKTTEKVKAIMAHICIQPREWKDANTAPEDRDRMTFNRLGVCQFGYTHLDPAYVYMTVEQIKLMKYYVSLSKKIFVQFNEYLSTDPPMGIRSIVFYLDGTKCIDESAGDSVNIVSAAGFTGLTSSERIETALAKFEEWLIKPPGWIITCDVSKCKMLTFCYKFKRKVLMRDLKNGCLFTQPSIPPGNEVIREMEENHAALDKKKNGLVKDALEKKDETNDNIAINQKAEPTAANNTFYTERIAESAEAMSYRETSTPTSVSDEVNRSTPKTQGRPLPVTVYVVNEDEMFGKHGGSLHAMTKKFLDAATDNEGSIKMYSNGQSQLKILHANSRCNIKENVYIHDSSSSKPTSDSPSIDYLIDLSRKLVAKKRLCESFQQQHEEFQNSGGLQAFKLKLKKTVPDIDHVTTPSWSSSCFMGDAGDNANGSTIDSEWVDDISIVI